MCVAERRQSEKMANYLDPVLQVLGKANYEDNSRSTWGEDEDERSRQGTGAAVCENPKWCYNHNTSGYLSKLIGHVAESGPVRVHAVVRRQLVIISSSCRFCQHFWMGSEWSFGRESISALTLEWPSLSEAPSTGEPSQDRTWMSSLGLPQGFSLTWEKSWTCCWAVFPGRPAFLQRSVRYCVYTS